MSASEAKEVEVSANLGGKKIHPVSVSVSGTVNSFMEGKLTYISKAKKAETTSTDITSKDVITTLAQYQTESFSPESFDSEITMKDADGGSLSLYGCVSSPVYTFSVSQFGCDVRMQQAVAKVNAIDMAIYPAFFICAETAVEELDISNYNTVPEYFMGVFDYFLNKGGEAIADADIPDEDKKNRQVQHEINKKAGAYVSYIMSASGDSFGWDGLLSSLNENPEGKDVIRDRIVSIIKKRSGGFFNNILNFASEFQCVYVPDFNYGKLVNYKNLLTGDKTTHELGVIALSAQIGSRGMFPVCCVGAHGIIRHCAEEAVGERGEYTMYPKEGPRDLGTMEVIQGPPWLPESAWDAEIVHETNTTLQQLKLPPDEAKKTVEEVQKLAETGAKTSLKIIDEWVKNEYYWNALGQTYATVQTELATNCQVGQRVKLKSKGGAELFTGTIWKIEHKVVSGDIADATSTIEFSHIIMNGAIIPGIDDAS